MYLSQDGLAEPRPPPASVPLTCSEVSAEPPCHRRAHKPRRLTTFARRFVVIRLHPLASRTNPGHNRPVPDHAHIPDSAPPDLTPFELDVALLTLSTSATDGCRQCAESLAAALDIEPAHFLHVLARPHVAAFIHAAVALERFRADLAASRAHAEALEALATVARNRDNDIQKRARAATAILRSIGAARSTRATDRCSERSVSPSAPVRSKASPHTDTLALLTTALEHFTTTSLGADTPDPEATTLDQILAILPGADPARILDACALNLRTAGLDSILAAIPELSAAAGRTLARQHDTFAENGWVVRQCTFTAETGDITLELTLHNFGYRTQRWRITAIAQIDPTRPSGLDNNHDNNPDNNRDNDIGADADADTTADTDDDRETPHADADLRDLTLPELNTLLQQAIPSNNTHPP